MTNKDLFRLAKISLAARKKTTKSTVRGIAFGLILLIPVLFIAMGIFGDLNKKVNANTEILYMGVTTAASRVSVQDDASDRFQPDLSSSHADNLKKNIKVKEIFDYEQIVAPFNPLLVDPLDGEGEDYNMYSMSTKAFDLSIGEIDREVYVFKNGKGDNSSYGNYSVNSTDVPFAAIVEGTKFIPDKMTKKFGDVFLAGGGFTGDGKCQVVVSETFINSLGYENAADFLGKRLSVKYEDIHGDYGNYVYIDNDTEPDELDNYIPTYESSFPYNGSKEIYFCQNYEIVGIIKDTVTRYAMDLYGDGRYGNLTSIMTNMMFFTSASKYYDDGVVLEPVINVITKQADDEFENYTPWYYLATYLQDKAEFAEINNTYMAFGANSFNSLKYSNNSSNRKAPYATRTLFIDPSSFAQLDSAVSTLSAEFSALYGKEIASVKYSTTSQVYQDVSMMYNAFTYVVLGLSVVGGIIFFASMVNLFNSIVHSVDSRKSYLGVLRAVGAKRSLINKMYLAESLTIFKRALIWILIFATLICVGIKLVLDIAFRYINESGLMPFNLGVGFQYIPIALAIGLGVLLILGFAFSYGCSWKVSRDPITKTLAS